MKKFSMYLLFLKYTNLFINLNQNFTTVFQVYGFEKTKAIIMQIKVNNFSKISKSVSLD